MEHVEQSSNVLELLDVGEKQAGGDTVAAVDGIVTLSARCGCL
jgi:hypothetical protein